MKHSSATKQSTRPQKIRLVAKNSSKVKKALNSWVEASDKVDSDPLKLDDAPSWVESAWAEVVKVLMPGNRLPTEGEWDLELLGELMGRLQAFGKLYSGEIPMSPEAKAEADRFEKFAASQPQSPERTAREKVLAKDFQTRVNAVQEGIPNLMAGAMASSHEDTLKFERGLQRGLNLSPDELVSANIFERHTRTYFVLALHWKTWMTCKSLRHVYDLLYQAVGEKNIGTFRTFEKACNKIGFKIRGRGRPPGGK